MVKPRPTGPNPASRGAPPAVQAVARGGGPRPVGALVAAVGGMAFRRFGFVQAELVARWPEIVGPDYARWTLPQSIRQSRTKNRGGTLTILVESAFAPRLQHVLPTIIERANRLFGHGAVEAVRLVHGHVPRPAATDRRRPTAVPGVASNLRGIDDEGLNSALEALAGALALMGEPPRIG